MDSEVKGADLTAAQSPLRLRFRKCKTDDFFIVWHIWDIKNKGFYSFSEEFNKNSTPPMHQCRQQKKYGAYLMIFDNN